MNAAPPRITRALSVLRHLLLACCLAGTAGTALADDYAEVNQLLRAGRPAEALSRAEQSLSARPRDPQMRFLRGVAQTESGRGAEAIATFTRLTEDYPELPEPYNNLAVLYAAQNQFDKARAALEMAVRANPSYATAHENLGDVYARMAAQSYARAAQLDAGAASSAAPKQALLRELLERSARPSPPRARPAAAPAASPAAATPSAQSFAPARTPAR